MSSPELSNQTYLEGLLLAYEGEIGGEEYFKTMATIFTEPIQQEKMMLLAVVEQRTWMVLQPLIERHNLTPRDHQTLQAWGNSWIDDRGHRNWQDLINSMVSRYPAYILKFKSLETICPDEDKTAIRALVEHEVVLLDFAGHEQAGNTDSLARVHSFLEEHSSLGAAL
ncbi:MAG: hypothetical protein HON65_01645 [Rhodospirillales bacterium]|jgi:hypothetical protein|nr:hypothetical protein [Rhodospirillales bacterium]